MRIGDLRNQIILQAPTIAKDTYGVETQTFTAKATVFAQILPLRGNEYINAQQLQTAVTHMIRLRYRMDVKTGWRAVYGNRTFEIVEPPINPGERNIFLELMCVEKK